MRLTTCGIGVLSPSMVLPHFFHSESNAKSEVFFLLLLLRRESEIWTTDSDNIFSQSSNKLE